MKAGSKGAPAPLEHVTDLLRTRNLEKAHGALVKLARRKGAAGVDWRQAASIAVTLGDQELSLAILERWRNENPADPHRHIAVINALGAVARHREAAALARKLQDNPRAGAEGLFLEAYYQARFGNVDNALELYRRVLSQSPSHTPAWEQIALLQGHDDLDADIASMESLARSLKNPGLLIPLHYALGRAYDLAGDPIAAFEHLARGAALRERTSPFRLQPQVDYYSRLQATFTRERIAAMQNAAGGEGAVFIISAPRSGTTLVEQILSMADAVVPTGEHTIIRLASLPLASMEPPDMARAEQMGRSSWQKMAQVYRRGVERRFRAGVRFTDKSLLNHNFAGLIRILFPEARFVWLRRDPRDVAWSCFRSRISANQWTQTLENCARYLQAHEALCSHWRQVFGEAMLELSYEELVSAPEESTARLFQYLGWQRPDNWSEFYRSASPVATASLAQVRQPLSSSAIGSWRRYEEHLAPVFDEILATAGSESATASGRHETSR